MALWLVEDFNRTFNSVSWSDGIRGDVYVYCSNTGLFHPNKDMTHSYYTGLDPYRFMPIRPGSAAVMIQEECGSMDRRPTTLRAYKENPEHLTVQNVMLTVSKEYGRVKS